MVTWPARPWRMAGPLPYLAVPLARKRVGHPTPDAFAGRGQLSNFLSLSTQQLMGSSREHSYPTADELALWLRMTSGRDIPELVDRGRGEERGVPSGLLRTRTAEKPSEEGTPVLSIVVEDRDRSRLELDLDALLREGARRMLVTALKVEVDAYVAAHAEERDGQGHALVVRNGVAEPRKVTTAAGELEIQAPRVDDRREGC